MTFVFQLTTSQGGRQFIASSTVNSGIISTHDLTRRSTQLYGVEFNIPLFQLTTSQGGRPGMTQLSLTVRTFQLTTSQGGRREHPSADGQSDRISTHDLTRRSTYRKQSRQSRKAFQLTTSQGGRQQFLHKKFSFQNHFLCSLHIIHSYYINIAFFSTLFLQNLHFFWCESPRIFLFTCLSHSAF